MTIRRTAALMAATLVVLAQPNRGMASAPKPPAQPATQPGASPAPLRITMQNAVELGLRNSRALAAAAEAVDRARGVVTENRAGYVPNLSATATLTHLDEGSSVSLPVGSGGAPVVIPLVKQNQGQIGVTAGVPIDVAGLIGAAVSAAHFQEIGARLAYNQTRNQTVLDVKSAYLDVLRVAEYVGVADQNLRNAQEQQATAEAHLRAGTGTRFEVLRAQTAVADAQQGLIAARNRVDLAKAALANLLAVDQHTPFETVQVEGAGGTMASFDAGLDEAYRARPDILAAEASIRAAEKGVTLANRSLLPSLSLGWNLSYSPDAGGFSPKTTAWAAVATVSLPIFDGGVAAARRQQARAGVNTARIAKQQAMDGVALQVRQAQLAVVEAQERERVAIAALAQAEEQYRLADVRFRAGVTLTPGGSPQLEISDARSALAQARTNRINASYDLASAQARYESALGRYAYGGTTGPGLASPGTGGVR